jgi:hypothetical protein
MSEYRSSFDHLARDPEAQESARKLLKKFRKQGGKMPGELVAYLRLKVSQRSKNGAEARCA